MLLAAWLLAFHMNIVPDLDSLRWHSRVVIAFASGQNDPKLKEQSEIASSHRQGFAERDIETFELAGETPEVWALREKLNTGREPFTVVLIGKDGSVKLKKHDPLTADELFRTIDKMPMRKREMKEEH